MIKTKKELDYYIQADYMMNRGYFRPTIRQRLKNALLKDYIMEYIVCLRKYEYYTNQKGWMNEFLRVFFHYKYRKLGKQLGFSIEPNVLGFGLCIPHYGTIVVGAGNRIGNYCVLHTSTCVTAGNKKIGNNFYLASGAKVIRKGAILGDNISVAANSVINGDFPKNNILLAGNLARIIKESDAWYDRDGEMYRDRVEACNKLYKEIYS